MLHSNFCSNEIIFKVHKLSFIDLKYFLFVQTKHKISIISKVKKYQGIQTTNVHLSDPSYKVQVYFSLSNFRVYLVLNKCIVEIF